MSQPPRSNEQGSHTTSSWDLLPPVEHPERGLRRLLRFPRDPRLVNQIDVPRDAVQTERLAEGFPDALRLIPTLHDARVANGIRLSRRGLAAVAFPHRLPHQDAVQFRRRKFLEDLRDCSVTRLTRGARRRQERHESDLPARCVELLTDCIDVQHRHAHEPGGARGGPFFSIRQPMAAVLDDGGIGARPGDSQDRGLSSRSPRNPLSRSKRNEVTLEKSLNLQQLE